MPWARFEDDYLSNRKLVTLSTAAIALDMAGIIYSARELRDGVLSAADVHVVTSLIHIRKWQVLAAELVDAHRWHPREEGGFVIHDYLDYQPSRQQILAERAAGRDRKRRERAPNGHFVRPDSGGNPQGIPRESNGSHNAPVPGPGPGPGSPSQNFPETPPNPPRKRRGRSGTSVDFELDGPKYEQRLNSDGKREWVQVEA